MKCYWLALAWNLPQHLHNLGWRCPSFAKLYFWPRVKLHFIVCGRVLPLLDTDHWIITAGSSCVLCFCMFGCGTWTWFINYCKLCRWKRWVVTSMHTNSLIAPPDTIIHHIILKYEMKLFPEMPSEGRTLTLCPRSSSPPHHPSPQQLWCKSLKGQNWRVSCASPWQCGLGKIHFS